VRTLAAALIIAFHQTLGLFILLAAAPFVSRVVALGLLPGAVGARLAARRGDGRARFMGRGLGVP